MNLVRSELVKIRTTNTWWLFGLGALVMLALSFLVNAVSANFSFDNADQMPEGMSPDQAEQFSARPTSSTRRPTSTPRGSSSACCSSCCWASCW